jgi:glycosyltransferase involved in cell wall biosynthesis
MSATAQEVPMFRVAVVTPYHKETDAVLSQCHDSVLGQTYPCTHLLVADGHPRQSLFAASGNTMHVVLPQENGDNGNTPRAVGGICADSYGFDAVAYLDADNWFEPDHIENLVRVHETSGSVLITCKRKYYDLAGNLLPISQLDEDRNLHVDTSCWLIFRPAFANLRVWLMPKPLSPLCDRIFFRKILNDRYTVTATDYRSVAFRTQYADHYIAAGRAVPDGAKGNDWWRAALEFLHSPVGIAETTKQLGFYPAPIFAQIGQALSAAERLKGV